MLLACLKNMMAGKPMAVDEVRITVAPQMSMDEYREYAGHVLSRDCRGLSTASCLPRIGC